MACETKIQMQGPDSEQVTSEPADSAVAGEARRVHTIRLNGEQDGPPVARVVAAPETSPPEPAKTPEPVPVAKAPSPPAQSKEPARQAKPVVDPAPARPAVVVRQTAPAAGNSGQTSAGNSGWVVQLGSFSSQQNAQQLADDVSQRGFSAYLTAVDRSGKKLYRVRVGPKPSRPQAEELAGQLNRAGYQGQVTQQ